IGAVGHAVDLVLERGGVAYSVIDLVPSIPVLNVRGDLVQRLDVPGLGELAHPGAVDADHVGSATGVQVERDLGLVVLVIHSLRFEGERDVPPLLLLHRRELGDYVVLDPRRGFGVLATHDGVACHYKDVRVGVRSAARRAGRGCGYDTGAKNTGAQDRTAGNGRPTTVSGARGSCTGDGGTMNSHDAPLLRMWRPSMGLRPLWCTSQEFFYHMD